jgi:hypothetical protein
VHPIFLGIWLPLFLCLGETFHLALPVSHQGSLESDRADDGFNTHVTAKPVEMKEHIL